MENQQTEQEDRALEAALAGEQESAQESSESEQNQTSMTESLQESTLQKSEETAQEEVKVAPSDREPEEETAPATVEAINAEEESEQPGESAQTETPVDGTPAPDVEKETPATGEPSDGLETKLEDIKPALALPAIVSGRFRHIEDKLSQRIRISRSWQHTGNPYLKDSDDWTEYAKSYKEHSKQYRQASVNANSDMQSLCLALRTIQIDHPALDVGNYIENAFLSTPRESESEQAATSSASSTSGGSKPIELEGQLKLELKSKDDGSTAEPAGECTTITGEAAQAVIAEMDAAPAREALPVPEIDKEKLTGYFLKYFDISEEHDDLAVRAAMKAVLSAALELEYTPEMLKTTVMNSKNDESFYGLSNTNRVLGILATEKELKVDEAAFLAQQKAEAEAKKAKKTTAPKEAKGKKETNEKPAAKGKAKAASHADKPVSGRKTGKGKSAAGKTAGT